MEVSSHCTEKVVSPIFDIRILRVPKLKKIDFWGASQNFAIFRCNFAGNEDKGTKLGGKLLKNIFKRTVSGFFDFHFVRGPRATQRLTPVLSLCLLIPMRKCRELQNYALMSKMHIKRER